MKNKPWTEKGALCWHWNKYWNKKIVPLKKIKPSADHVVTSGSKWLHADQQNGVNVVEKATMHLFDLFARSDQFLWTNMFCRLHFVNVEPCKVKKAPCNCQWMRKQKHTLPKKKKNRAQWCKISLLISFHALAVVGLGASQSVTGRDAPLLIKMADCWNDTFLVDRTVESLSRWYRRCVTWRANPLQQTWAFYGLRATSVPLGVLIRPGLCQS